MKSWEVYWALGSVYGREAQGPQPEEQKAGCLLQLLSIAPAPVAQGDSGLWEVDPSVLWRLCCSLKVKTAFLGLPGTHLKWPPSPRSCSPSTRAEDMGSVMPIHPLTNSFRVGPVLVLVSDSCTKRRRTAVPGPVLTGVSSLTAYLPPEAAGSTHLSVTPAGGGIARPTFQVVKTVL